MVKTSTSGNKLLFWSKLLGGRLTNSIRYKLTPIFSAGVWQGPEWIEDLGFREEWVLRRVCGKVKILKVFFAFVENLWQELQRASSTCRRGTMKGVKLQETPYSDVRTHSGQEWERLRGETRQQGGTCLRELEAALTRWGTCSLMFKKDKTARHKRIKLLWARGWMVRCFTVNVNDCMMISSNTGMVAKARSLSSWNRARKEKNKEAIRRMFDPERVFSNRIDTVEEEARAGGGVWDILGKGIDSFLGRNGEAEDEELPVWWFLFCAKSWCRY